MTIDRLTNPPTPEEIADLWREINEYVEDIDLDPTAAAAEAALFWVMTGEVSPELSSLLEAARRHIYAEST